MPAIEILLYGITALIVIWGVVIFISIQVTLKNRPGNEYRRQYWRAMLEKAQREVERNEPNKQPD